MGTGLDVKELKLPEPDNRPLTDFELMLKYRDRLVELGEDIEAL